MESLYRLLFIATLQKINILSKMLLSSVSLAFLVLTCGASSPHQSFPNISQTIFGEIPGWLVTPTFSQPKTKDKYSAIDKQASEIFLKETLTKKAPSHKRSPHSVSDEENLLSYLFANYNPSARPVLNSSATVFVNLKFSLLQIQELNARNQILTSTGFLILEWKDERLTWSRDISQLDEVVVKGENIWKPEFAVINGAESIYGEYVEFQATLRADGFLRWEPGGIFKTMCSIDITFYPFDTQRCEIKFGAWSYHTTKMNLTTDERNIRIDAYEKNGEWQVIDTDAQRNEFAFECCPTQRFSYISFAVELRRRQTFYVMNVILPGLLTSAVLLSLFYCVPSQKVHIGVAALLSFRLFLVNVADTVPRTSDHIPLLGIYLTCTMAITTLAMVATVLVGNLYERKDRPVPKWLKKLMMDHVARVLCMGRDGNISGENAAFMKIVKPFKSYKMEKPRERGLSWSLCCLDLLNNEKQSDDERSSEHLKEDEELHMMASYDPRSRRTNVKAHRTRTTLTNRTEKNDSQGMNKISRSKSFDIGSALASLAARQVNDALRLERTLDKSHAVQRHSPALSSISAVAGSVVTSEANELLNHANAEGMVKENVELAESGRVYDSKCELTNKKIEFDRISYPKKILYIGDELQDTKSQSSYGKINVSLDPQTKKRKDLQHYNRNKADNDYREFRYRRNSKVKVAERDSSQLRTSQKSRKDTSADKQINYSKDWAHLAAVCDRFFFWLCLFFILGTTLLLFHPLTTSRFFKIPVIDKS